MTELCMYIASRKPGQIRMIPAVIAYDVPHHMFLLHEVRVCLNLLPNNEKSGADAVLMQDTENLRRICRIGAIVEGQGDFRLSAAPLGNQRLEFWSPGRRDLRIRCCCLRRFSRG